MSIVSSRWETPFGKWVQAFGVRNVCEALYSYGLPIGRETVYHWMAGRAVPNPRKAMALIKISEGKLTFDDIYGQKDAHDAVRAREQSEVRP